MEQERKVESLSSQISDCINSRKWFVEKYNTLLKYPKTKENKAKIYKSLSQLYDAITEYDEKIEDLAKDKIDAEVKLNEYISEVWSVSLPNNPIDPDKWDFLLTIQ
jgi:flagellar hook-associated protein FlgK